MTGRSTELSEILKARQISACCVQETKWKGSKSRDIGNGYQLVYHGTDTKRNGVDIGVLLTANKDIKIRWKEYYEQLMNEEFSSQNMPPVEGPIKSILEEEVSKAISKMKYDKTTGPDQIPADLWKKLKESATPWLTKLFSAIIKDGKIPQFWQKAMRAMRAQNIPEYYVILIQDMYINTKTRVKSPAGLGEPFHVNVGVHQGSALSPLLFNLCKDYITRDIQKPAPECILYADDIVLVAKNAQNLQETLNRWVTQIENHGLRISRSKTEYFECDYGGSEETGCNIYIDNRALPKVDNFKYLGSVLITDANIDKDVDHRIKTVWIKWKSLSGVLCDHRMPIRIKGKVYKTVVRPIHDLRGRVLDH
ncbi:uncharacterized protein LOC126773490 [Nymphalis io]|uniref:uncharacterized protein LOC126773490 n=1 Tax=Inachis io TaxID=171585 RepID=UPI0021682981|nr:uncharacterized protein LOC126773490 [Nymphalis io]